MYTILVQDVKGYDELQAATLHEDATLEAVLLHLTSNAGLCDLYLVDSAGGISGVITRSTLVRWARVCLNDLSERVPVGDVFRMVAAARARDLAVGDAATLGVRPTDPLSKVLHQITYHDVGAIPVVDTDGRVIGDITVGEVLMKALEVRSHNAFMRG